MEGDAIARVGVGAAVGLERGEAVHADADVRADRPDRRAVAQAAADGAVEVQEVDAGARPGGGVAARGDTASGARSGVDFLHLHCAVGGGLRYRTPIGTVRADVGVRVNRLAALEADGRPNPDPGDRVAFHLSLAEPF